MWPKRRRRQILTSWDARRGEAGAAIPVAAVDPVMVTTRQRRATTGRIGALSLGALRRHPSRASAAITTAGLTLMLAHLGWSDRYTVHGAVVHGNGRVPAATVFAVSGLEGRNVFGVDRAAAERWVETLEDVRTAEVGVGFPNRAWIRVEETAPVLLWDIPGGRLAIDETGRAIGAPEGVDDLVHVRDEAARVQAAGDRLPIELVEAARAFGGRFGDLIYRADGGFTIQTAEGWPVRLGTEAGRVDEQAATLAALRERLIAGGRPVELVDLRFARGSYYRLREAGQ